MIGLSRAHLMELTIKPTLTGLGLWTAHAGQIVLRTAVAESNLKWLKQVPAGPGRGLWQIEPFTARDVLGRYLRRRDDLSKRVRATVYPLLPEPAIVNLSNDALGFALANNLALGAAICRLIYLWVPSPIPATLEGQAVYYVKYFNKGGKATPAKFIAAWNNC